MASGQQQQQQGSGAAGNGSQAPHLVAAQTKLAEVVALVGDAYAAGECTVEMAQQALHWREDLEWYLLQQQRRTH